MGPKSQPSVFTKTKSTIAAYERHYASLCRRTVNDLRAAGASVPDNSEPDPIAIATTFLEHEGSWAKSTARQYRAALFYVFSGSGTPDHQEAKRLIRGTSDARSEEDVAAHRASVEQQRNERKKKGELRGPAKKAKQVTAADMTRLIEAVVSSRSKYATEAALWFQVTILTGLRPTEWQNARLVQTEDGVPVLVVKNAKNTNGRAHGEYRHLILSGISRENIQSIARHIRNASEFHAHDFPVFHEQCQRLIHRWAKKLWPNRIKLPALYTARHMFSAEAKKNFGRASVAAMMGHASDETATQHYARKQYAHGSFGVEPDMDEVQRVMSLNSDRKVSARLQGVGEDPAKVTQNNSQFQGTRTTD